jgi:hypothetical protein
MQLKDILKDKCDGKFIKFFLILHDNAPVHRAPATQKKLFLPGLPKSWSPTVLCITGHFGLPPVAWTGRKLKFLHFSSNVVVIAEAEIWLDG